MHDLPFDLPNILDGEDKSSPFINCIRKSYKHLRKWAKRTSTNAFRIYDRQVPGFPVAIDFYAGRYCIHYFSTKRESQDPPNELKEAIASALSQVFDAKEESIFWRIRAKHKETRQYEKIGEYEDFFTVFEYGLKFKINLTDYLDTGLFLDHRETRRLVASYAKSKRVLNLFAYTCAFSVHAAAAGALFTKSVDLSNTYTAWGRDNFLLNELPLKNNPVVRADCLKFLDEEVRAGEMYDIIVIDPPTISRSKKMTQLFDIQKDYIFLITKALKLLKNNGIIFFSTNSRKFAFDVDYFDQCKIIEMTNKTLSIDFQNEKAHRCWKILKKNNES